MIGQSVKLVDKIVFIKNLGLMLKSGIPLLESIRTLTDSSQGMLQKILTQVSAELERGSSFYSALAKHESHFGRLMVSFVKIGEESGTLEENLFKLATFFEQIYGLRKKVIASLIYPAIIVCLSVVIGAVLSFFVFPKLIPFFESMHMELPLPTKILLWFSRFTQQYFLIILGAVITLCSVLTAIIHRNQKARYIFHVILLRAPIFGKIAVNYNIATLSRTLGSLQKSGIHVQRALNLTADSTNNLVYQSIINNVAEWIRNGHDIASYFSFHKIERYFPKVMIKMIEIGERSGNLEDIFFYNADFYEKEVDEDTKNLSNVIEPIMLIGIGIFVAFIAVSIITPIYQITRVLDK